MTASAATTVRGTATASDSSEYLTREQAAADLSDWKQRLLAIHPRPDNRISAAELDEAIELVHEHLPDKIDRVSLFILLSGVAARLGDSHTSFAPPRELRSARLPIVVEDDALCLESSHGTVPAGACLLTLGGHSADELLGWSRRLASAETPSGVDRLVPRTLPALLYALEAVDPLPVRAVESDGNVVDAALPLGDVELPEYEALTVERLPGDIALLTLRTLVQSPGYRLQQTFEETFAQIAREPTRGVVIDIRDNDGGSTAVADSLLSYVTDRPHRMFAKKYWKVSAPMKEHVEDLGISAPDYLEAPVGEAVVYGVELQSVTPSVHRFEGPTVFLIGPGTLSAAMMMADAIHEYELALLVGEPTSSPPTYFGEVYTYTLPHSGLTATISSAAFLRASGDPDAMEPVHPHITVKSRIADRILGRDEALASAIRLIEARASVPDAGPVSPEGAAPDERFVPEHDGLSPPARLISLLTHPTDRGPVPN